MENRRLPVMSQTTLPRWACLAPRYVTCRSHTASHSEYSESQTHASLANHSCITWQSGQCVWLKNTGVERKIAGAANLPVEIARPVFGQRIIIMPIWRTPVATGVCVPLVVGLVADGGLTSAGQEKGKSFQLVGFRGLRAADFRINASSKFISF